MSRYASVNMLKNGPQYLKDNCDKVILTNAYTATYATANTTAKVAECTLVTGDFAITGADGAAQTLTATLTGKAAGNALTTVFNVLRVHVTTLLKRTAIKAGKRTVTISEGETR